MFNNKPVIIIFLLIILSGCSEKITTQSFVPENTSGLLNLDFFEIQNTEYFTDLKEGLNDKPNVNPLDLINLTLELSFGANINGLLYCTIFFIENIRPELNFAGGIIFEFEELNHKLISKTFENISGLEIIEYSGYTIYYSEILNSCISVYNNFVFCSYSIDVMENILDKIENNKNIIDEDLTTTLKASGKYIINGAYKIRNSNFKFLNDTLLKYFDIDPSLIYENILSSNVIMNIFCEFSEVWQISIKLNFISISDAKSYSEYLEKLSTGLKEKIDSLNESGEYDFYADLLNNTNIHTDDFSILININIPGNSFIDFFIGFF